MTNERIGCVVVTYEADRYVAACLDSAVSAGLESIVLWDNASQDKTVAVARERTIANLQIVESEENLGFARAVNRSIDLLPESKYFLLLNPDCLVSRETIASMVELLESDDSLGAVAPAMRFPDGSLGVPGGAFPSIAKEFLSRTKIDQLLTARTKEVVASILERLHIGRSLTSHIRTSNSRSVSRPDWVSGFCLLARSDAWKAVGGLDERFFLYFEDVAFCKRLQEHGWGVAVDGRTTAEHDESASAKLNGKSARYTASMWKYFRHYGSAGQRSLARVMRAGLV